MKTIHRFPKIISVLLIFSIFSSASAEGLSIDPIKLINKISNRLFEIGISTARSFAEISYEDVRYDPNLETFFIDGKMRSRLFLTTSLLTCPCLLIDKQMPCKGCLFTFETKFPARDSVINNC